MRNRLPRRWECRFYSLRISARPPQYAECRIRDITLGPFLVSYFRNGLSQVRLTFLSFFFFGGLSIHLSQALLAHLFSYNITWGATKKEVERSNFWLEVPKILQRFWIALVICIIISSGMVILSTGLVPLGWRIPGWDWAVIVPLA